MEAKTKTELPVLREELQKLPGKYAFTRNLGLSVHSLADGECTLHVPFQAAFERPGGIVSGQVFMTAADVAMWFATISDCSSRLTRLTDVALQNPHAPRTTRDVLPHPLLSFSTA
jgi:acyl-coenzyme A thioesterase PaaI-like protein